MKGHKGPQELPSELESGSSPAHSVTLGWLLNLDAAKVPYL
jgi:hypothetical protein